MWGRLLVLAPLIFAQPRKITFQSQYESPLHASSGGAIWLDEPVTGSMEITFRAHTEAWAFNANPAVSCGIHYDSRTVFDIPKLRLFGVVLERPDGYQPLPPGPFGYFSRSPVVEKTIRVELDKPFQFAEWSYQHTISSGSNCGAGAQEVWPRVSFTAVIYPN